MVSAVSFDWFADFGTTLETQRQLMGGGKKSKREREIFGRRKVKNFLCADFFIARLPPGFFPPPLTAPGSLQEPLVSEDGLGWLLNHIQ